MTFNSSINRSLFGAITLMNCVMNLPNNQMTLGIEIKKKKIIKGKKLLLLMYHCSIDIMPVF